jgi:hypothetical protein
MMHFVKENPNTNIKRTVLTDWTWAKPTYNFPVSNQSSVKKITIDPSGLMADVKTENNILEVK